MKTLAKDPDAVLDYTIDWTPFLTSVDDTIATSEFITDEDTSLTLSNEALNGNLHTVFIAGGAANTRHRVTSRITTAGGRTQDQSFFLVIAER